MDMALWDDPPMSMAMTQEPIDWRYLPYIYIYKALFFRPKFQGISPQFIWSNIWYVYVPPVTMEVLSMSSPQKNVVGLPASIVEIHGEKGHHGFSQKKIAV